MIQSSTVSSLAGSSYPAGIQWISTVLTTHREGDILDDTAGILPISLEKKPRKPT